MGRGGGEGEQNKNRKWPAQGFSMGRLGSMPGYKEKKEEKGHL